jgi:hypothetical protein
MRERDRSKVGRKPRLRNQVEVIAGGTDELRMILDAEVAEKLKKMREEERAKQAAG